MLYAVAALAAVLGFEIFLRMRANKLVMQRIERLASEMIGIVTSLPTQKAQTVVELQQAFGKQLTDTRNAIGKELNVIRTSYAAIFHGFVAHADYYHTPGPSNGKVDWKTIAGLRPIAALAKLMKMEQAMAEAKKHGLVTIGLLGGDGGTIKETSDIAIVVPSKTTARIQEVHMLVLHAWCAEIVPRL